MFGLTMPGFRIVDDNLHAAMRFFGEATGTGEIRNFDAADAVYSGLDYGVFNMAFLTARISVERDLGPLLTTLGRYYKERSVRWSFWLCHDLLEPSRRRPTDVFAAAGLRPISQAPGMVAPALTAPVRPLPALECRPVADPVSRAAFAHLTSLCFDIPYPTARAVYGPEHGWEGDYRGFVGWLAGEPVSMIALVRAFGSLGIYSLGTLPQHRRKGCGEALLRAALAQTSPAPAAEPLVLESTEAGYPLYRRLGFQDVTKFTVYLTK
jgi:GNAT superfamily N-acetyltransferase